MKEYGCWFCDEPVKSDYFFSFEWDCEMHIACIVRAKREGNPEAEIVYRELGMKITDQEEQHEIQ